MESVQLINKQLLAHHNKPGTYLIVLHLVKNRKCVIGKMGERSLEKGYYLYIGSALGSGGMAARVKHHLRKTNNPHWHIDYIREIMQVNQLWLDEGKKRMEHRWAGKVRKLAEFRETLRGFGSSDCNCYSHLFYSSQRPITATLSKHLSPTIEPVEI